MLVLVTAVLAAVLAAAVFWAEQRQYPVHSSGIVLVTGASSGIGRHAAEHLADKHPFLVLAGVRKAADAQKILAMNKRNFQPLIIDVADYDSCVTAVDELKSIMANTGLPFVGLVNNAGIGGGFPVEFHPREHARRIMNTNFWGTFDLTQLVLPLLRQSKGRVVMISSIAGFFSGPLGSVYSATKFAMEALTDSLRREMLNFDVSVSSVQPGFVKSSIIDSARAQTSGDMGNEEMVAVYGKLLTKLKMLSNVMDSADLPDTSTTPAIVHALTSPMPKTRYVVASVMGIPGKVLGWLMWLLSDRLADKLQ